MRSLRNTSVSASYRRLGIFLLLIGLTALGACQSTTGDTNEGTLAVELAPGMRPIGTSGVPMLHEKVKECAEGSGVTMWATWNDSSRVSMMFPDADAAPRKSGHGPRNPRYPITGPRKDGVAFNVSIQMSTSESFDRAVLTVWNWENKPVFQKPLRVPLDADLGFIVKGQGTYLLTLDMFLEDAIVSRLVRSFSVAPDASDRRDAWSNSDYWIGICAFPGRYHWSNGGKSVLPEWLREREARELEAQLVGRLGLTHLRVDVSAVMREGLIVPADWGRMDDSISQYLVASEGKVRLDLQLMHPPDWTIDPKYANEKENKWRFPRREDAYRRYVREIVSRYGKHAAFVQIYNEPDQVEFWPGEPSEYIEEVKRAKDEIRKLLPGMPITNGGYAFIDPKKTEYYVKELKGLLDLQAYHSHGNLRELIRDREMMVKLHEEAGYEKPRFINTECGYATWRLDQERSQAIATLQKILYSWAHGDEGMLLFCSRMTKGPGRWDRDFGLLDFNFCPRFAYGAVAAFVDTYAGARFERVLSDKGNVHAYVFNRGDEKIVALFAMDRAEHVTLSSDAKAGWLIDAMGNGADLPAREISVQAEPYLKTVVLKGATRVELRI